MAVFAAELQSNCQLEHFRKAVRAELDQTELRLIIWHKVFPIVDVMKVCT